jgi:DNA replication and repair protein RecF
VIDWFSLEHFRNITAGRIDPAGESVGIVGPNGSGKTSVLEALYVLGHGRSFRTAQRAGVIARFADRSRVVCSLTIEHLRIGVEIGRSELTLRVDARPATLAQIASALPIQLLDPSVHLLVEEGAARRRKLLDWGVFHVEPGFTDQWRAYRRGLRQRNAALRARMWTVADAIGEQLIAPAEAMDRMRRDYFSKLLPTFEEVRAEVLGERVELEYSRGWASEIDFRASLERTRDTDHRLRATTSGPHRADLRLLIGKQPAREIVSRGQQKLLASTLVLSQSRYLAAVTGQEVTLLLDDPAAELDVDNLGKLLGAVARTPAQVIATSLSVDGLKVLPLGRLFHVKQGQITPML